ncbi:MAG TPA: DUF3016 domain-containing protein [Rudaea sp.]|jgi:hypothetical protein|uniref:DUF3016 domain-containing protein n=1 Tax=Rudaea sp. TaxID=2136325 RepID=UPI002F94FAF8
MNALRRLNSRSLALLASAFFALAASATSVLAREPLPERIQVEWAPTDTLSEVKNNQMQRGWLRPADWQKSLGEYLRKRADLKLPPGEQLEVTINDIKLAGDFEPWHGPNAQDIRIMKDLYPPRIDLHYKLVGNDGATIREGDSKLRDLAYLQRTVPFNNDPLRYDKRLLDDWITREFVRNRS